MSQEHTPKLLKLLRESKLHELVKSDRFYACLILPLILSFLIYYCENKIFVVLLSVVLGVTLIPLVYSVLDIFERKKDAD